MVTHSQTLRFTNTHTYISPHIYTPRSTHLHTQPANVCTSAHVEVCTRPRPCTLAHARSLAHLHTSATLYTLRGSRPARPRSGEATHPEQERHQPPATSHQPPAPPLTLTRARARDDPPPRGWFLLRSPRPRHPPSRGTEERRPAGGDPSRWRAPPPASRSPARVARIYISKSAPSEKKCKKIKKKV